MKKIVKYEEAIVTYLDILGFRELIRGETAGRISKTIRLVRDALKPDSAQAKVYEMTYQSFSDLTVVSIPVLTVANLNFRPGVLRSQLVSVAHAQVDLLREGILLRGAVTLGSIVRSHAQLFGPALIRAYEMESKEAKYPRIIIDEKIFRELKRNPALTKHGSVREQNEVISLLSKDSDQYWFVDYLRELHSVVEAQSFRGFLRQHRHIIKKGLREFGQEKRILEKYKWLADYHNRTIRTLEVRHVDSILV